MVATTFTARSLLQCRKSTPFKRLREARYFRHPPLLEISLPLLQQQQQQPKVTTPTIKQPLILTQEHPKTHHTGKKTVRFAPTLVQVQELHRSDTDLRQSWYTANEYAQFERDRRRTVSAWYYMGGDCCYSNLDPCRFTVLGLERHLDRNMAMNRRRVTKEHCHTVLQQQHYVSCVEQLRAVSEYFSTQQIPYLLLGDVLDEALRL